jgi:hypothetical protein
MESNLKILIAEYYNSSKEPHQKTIKNIEKLTGLKKDKFQYIINEVYYFGTITVKSKIN